jgi:hypothetical protein
MRQRMGYDILRICVLGVIFDSLYNGQFTDTWPVKVIKINVTVNVQNFYNLPGLSEFAFPRRMMGSRSSHLVELNH